MRIAVVVLLLIPAVAGAQNEVLIPVTSEWAGVMDYVDSAPKLRPTYVTLTIKDGTVTGRWRGGSQGSTSAGDITGTIDNTGKTVVKFTLFGGAEAPNDKGGYDIVAIERCSGEATLKGQLHRGPILRLTAPRIVLDTGAKRIKNTHCSDLRKFVWTLQMLR